MSEKKRQKKDGQDKNKDNQRMRAANSDRGKERDAGSKQPTGGVKRSHRIDSVRRGYNKD